MTTSTITGGASTITPQLIVGYSSTRPAKTIIHPVLGLSAPAVTLDNSGLRTGSLQCLFLTEAAASTSAGILATAAIFALADTVNTTVNMNFVVSGDIVVALDTDTFLWTVTFTYQETS